MELKTKYQYTYFIYPYLIEEKNYKKYLYKLLKNKNCNLKIFNKLKDAKMDSYFLPDIKNKMFWSLNLNNQNLSNFKAMDIKMQSTLLAQKYCNIFEYALNKDIPGKIGEKDGIFFDINKVEIVCFKTGICFLLIKTVLNSPTSFKNVINFNYKFKHIISKIAHTKEFENIKIQTQKFENMQKFSEFLTQITGKNILASKINLDTNKLITYSYACLEHDSWNENTDIVNLEKEFEKFRCVKSYTEPVNDIIYQKDCIYKEKHIYYGFSADTNVLLTNDSNIQNYTELLFEYENAQLYHYLYCLHQKIYLNKLNYEMKHANNFENIKSKFIKFAKNDWIYEITNNITGTMLDKYYKKELNLQNTFITLKSKYDLLYKDYQVNKTNKKLNTVILAIGVICVVFLIKTLFTIIA